MSDFLSNLVERTLGVAPVAQPIIAPLFAPKPALSVPGSTFLDEEEMLEAQPSANTVRLPGSRSVTQHVSSATRTVHQPVVSPEQPFSRMNDMPVPPQINSSMRQGEASPDPYMRAVPTHIREATNLANPQDESTKSALLTVTPARLEAEIQENTIVRVRDSPVHLQGARAGIVPQALQAESSERHEHLLIAPAEMQNRAIPALSSGQPGNRPLRKTSDDYPLSRNAPAIPHFNIHEIVESGDAPRLAHQQQDLSSQAVSKPHVPGELPSLPKRSIPTSEEQDMLVPHGANRPGKQVEQDIVRSQVRSPRAVYEQGSPATGRPSLEGSVSEMHSESGAELHPTESIEAPSTGPTIHVTIGRIDVRAITPPTATPRSKPIKSGPTLSLEEYARQKKEGR
jgi:hypothetical protein